MRLVSPLCDTAAMTIVLIAIVLYLIATALLIGGVRQEPTRPSRL